MTISRRLKIIFAIAGTLVVLAIAIIPASAVTEIPAPSDNPSWHFVFYKYGESNTNFSTDKFAKALYACGYTSSDSALSGKFRRFYGVFREDFISCYSPNGTHVRAIRSTGEDWELANLYANFGLVDFESNDRDLMNQLIDLGWGDYITVYVPSGLEHPLPSEGFEEFLRQFARLIQEKNFITVCISILVIGILGYFVSRFVL